MASSIDTNLPNHDAHDIIPSEEVTPATGSKSEHVRLNISKQQAEEKSPVVGLAESATAVSQGTTSSTTNEIDSSHASPVKMSKSTASEKQQTSVQYNEDPLSMTQPSSGIPPLLDNEATGKSDSVPRTENQTELHSTASPDKINTPQSSVLNKHIQEQPSSHKGFNGAKKPDIDSNNHSPSALHLINHSWIKLTGTPDSTETHEADVVREYNYTEASNSTSSSPPILQNTAYKRLLNGTSKSITKFSPPNDRSPRGPLYQPCDMPDSSRFKVGCHPRTEEVCEITDAFFYENWTFRTEQERQAFPKAEVNKWACMAMPQAMDDRIIDVCKCNTLLFLLDDVAEDMDIDEGKKYYARLIGIAQGNIEPAKDSPIEKITWDVWRSMRTKDEKLTRNVLEAAILCLKAQVDERRLHCTNMEKLLEYRGEEGGVLFVASLMCYARGLHVSESDLRSITKIYKTYSNIGMTVNDILSLDKEIRAWNSGGHKEGAYLLNLVVMMTDQLAIPLEASKRLLWGLCREWEIEHLKNVEDRLRAPEGCSAELKLYMEGLEYILGGNETWSWNTGRYHGQI